MPNIEARCLTVALTSAAACLGWVIACWSRGWTDLDTTDIVTDVVVTLTFSVIATISYDMYRMSPASSHTLISLWAHYVYVRKMLYYGTKFSKRDVASFKDADNFQNQRLMSILQAASKTKYGKDHGLDKITSMTEFKSKIPLSTYANIAPYVDRILQGEEDILFEGIPIYLGTTSGTTGKYKTYPKKPLYFEGGRIYISLKPLSFIYKKFPSCALKKILTIQVYHQPEMVQCGQHVYRKGPIMAAFAAHQPFYVTPLEGFFLEDAEASLYVTLLFGLREKDVGMISSYFCPPALLFFQKMEMHWEDVCNDIELGRIRRFGNIPEVELSLLQSQFTADPQRASFLRREFRKGFHGIAKRIWPKCEITTLITTGVFKSAGDILSSSYLSGIPNMCRCHGATESTYGTAHEVLSNDPEYHVVFTVNFIELLPISCPEPPSPSDVILQSEAVVGERYEIVLTTYEGLCRYRTADVIEAVGFDGKALKYKFCQRLGDQLCVLNEKTPVHVVESVLYETLRREAPLETVADYCCAESVHVNRVTGVTDGDMSYWIFVELKSNYRLTTDFSKKVDEGLAAQLCSYRRHRSHGTIDMVKVTQVGAGAFDELRSHIIATRSTAAVEQYKTPRHTRHDEFLRILLDRIVS